MKETMADRIKRLRIEAGMTQEECYQSYAKYFRENTEHLIGRRLTPHCLRHTHTALMAEAGVPIETISRRLGHADSKITMDVYMHVTNNMVERDRDRIKSVKMLTIC